MAGSALASRLYSFYGPTRRLTLLLSTFLQSLCIAVAAMLVQTDAVPESTPRSKLIFIAIPFLAAQSGAQIVTAKSLGFTEIPTTVLTTTYNDLAGDTQLFALRNPKRNRRMGAVAMLFIGGIAAAWVSRWKKSLVPVLWLGAGIKLLVTLSWLIFAEEEEE